VVSRRGDNNSSIVAGIKNKTDAATTINIDTGKTPAISERAEEISIVPLLVNKDDAVAINGKAVP
jgi:hypothetical protein